MTKEQEVITYIKKRIKICNENADVCDDNDFDEEATYLREESYMLETALNMLKENSAEIEQKNTELAEKSAEIEELKQALARNIAKKFTSSMKESAKAKEDLEMLNKGWQIELEKKDKQIDLMARAIDNYDSQLEINTFRDKEHVKQYFKEIAERKSEE